MLIFITWCFALFVGLFFALCLSTHRSLFCCFFLLLSCIAILTSRYIHSLLDRESGAVYNMTAGIRRRWNMECKKKYLPISNRHICPAQANLSQYSSGHMHTFFPIRCTWNLWKIFSLVETNRFYSSHFGESKTTTTTTKTQLKIREELRHKKNPFCLASKRHKLRLMVKSVCTHIPGREKESREKKMYIICR